MGIYIEYSGGSTGMVGLAWFITAFSEIIFFAVSARWLRKGNEIKMISLAAALYTARFALMAWADDPYVIVYLQLFQGITFVIFYVASMQYLYSVIPAEWRATGQTALAVIFFGVSGVVGSFAGGWIMDTYGGDTLYIIMSMFSLCGFLLSLLWHRNIENI
jgi:PPP family 3-phenylpropionic acid transporter